MFASREIGATVLGLGLVRCLQRSAQIPCFIAAALICVVALRAHDAGISTVEGRLAAGKLELVNGFAPADVELLLPEKLRTGEKWTETEFEIARSDLEKLAKALWIARAPGRSVPFRLIRVELAPGDAINFYLEAVVPGNKFRLEALKLAKLPKDHRQFVVILDGRGVTLTKKLLSNRETGMEIDATGPAVKRD
jgi:hypothetical protein